MPGRSSSGKPRKTRTSAFGVSKREAHDSSAFYERRVYPARVHADPQPEGGTPAETGVGQAVAEEWCDRLYCQSSERMPLPEGSVALAFTSPPYNVGKEYDDDLDLGAYLGLIGRVGAEVYRVLKPGGRYVVNIANLGRKPYIPLHAYFYQAHMQAGFLPMGEIIWQKGQGANGSCAWGSWMSARSPRIRDIHEYLLVFAKSGYGREEKGTSDISREEFMSATLSVWNIAPESARRVGHPAPFPLELARRVIHLFSYTGDVVLDPFMGSGSTCVAAKELGRRYVGFDTQAEYVDLAQKRLG
jgi:DNA modification methylase